MLDNLLIYRLILVNLAGAAIVAWAWVMGFVEPMFATDITGISWMVVALFVFGVVAVFRRALRVSRWLNGLKQGITPQVDTVKLLAKADHIGDIIEACAILGFLGTLIGLAMVIVGIDPNVDYKQTIVALKSGAGIAVYTSIIGAIAGLWLTVNRRILHTATICMIEDETALRGLAEG